MVRSAKEKKQRRSWGFRAEVKMASLRRAQLGKEARSLELSERRTFQVEDTASEVSLWDRPGMFQDH